MNASVSNIPAVPKYLVLLTKFKNMGDCEITGTHDVTVLYAGLFAAQAACTYAGYNSLKYGEAVSYLILNKVEYVRTYKDVNHGAGKDDA